MSLLMRGWLPCPVPCQLQPPVPELVPHIRRTIATLALSFSILRGAPESLATFWGARPSQPAPRASNQPCHLSQASASRRRHVAHQTSSPVRWQSVRFANDSGGAPELLARIHAPTVSAGLRPGRAGEVAPIAPPKTALRPARPFSVMAHSRRNPINTWLQPGEPARQTI